MKFLEEEDFEHISEKMATKVAMALLNNYINMDEPIYQSAYLGKMTSSDFSRFKDAIYDNLDLYGLGKLDSVIFQN